MDFLQKSMKKMRQQRRADVKDAKGSKILHPTDIWEFLDSSYIMNMVAQLEEGMPCNSKQKAREVRTFGNARICHFYITIVFEH